MKQKNQWAKNNLNYKFRKSISCKIRKALHLSNSTKRGVRTFDYLPYTLEELKAHLESQFEPWMNWDNWGHYRLNEWDDNDRLTWTWQIDHIIPQSSLPYDSLEHPNFKKCWGLDNLRPLSAKENLLKGSKIEKEDE